VARHRTRDFSRVLLPGSPERRVARYGPGAQSRPENQNPPGLNPRRQSRISSGKAAELLAETREAFLRPFAAGVEVQDTNENYLSRRTKTAWSFRPNAAIRIAFLRSRSTAYFVR
jgi:hypothetical protein